MKVDLNFVRPEFLKDRNPFKMIILPDFAIESTLYNVPVKNGPSCKLDLNQTSRLFVLFYENHAYAFYVLPLSR